MILRYGAPVLSLLRLARIMVETMTGVLRVRLGMGLSNRLGFLPRSLVASVEEELSRLEAILRRVLFLVAAEQGPLGPASPHAEPHTPPRSREFDTPRFGQGADRVPADPAPPLFRLNEPEAEPRPPEEGFGYAPRFAPQEADVPENAPAFATQAALVPAARLARRLLALEDVLRAPEPHILRMRRLLAQGAGKILSPQAGAQTPYKGRPEQALRILHKLQVQAEAVMPCLDPAAPDTG